MTLGGDALIGLFGNGAYDVIRRACEALLGTGVRDPLSKTVVDLTYDAFEGATSVFFARFGEAFGTPGTSFLARQENVERVLASLYSQSVAPRDILLERAGYDGAAPATDEAIQFFATTVEHEMRRNISLDALLTQKSIAATVEGIARRVGMLENRSKDTHLRPTAPPSSNKIVGRSKIIASAIKELTQSGAVVLTGMGGVGKTAIALELAHYYEREHKTGILWGPLNEYDGDPLPILRSWGRVCGVDVPATSNENEVSDIVRAQLSRFTSDQERQLLAVLDDAREEWLEGVALLRSVLPRETSVLVTSRHVSVAAYFDVRASEVASLNEDDGTLLLSAAYSQQSAGSDAVVRSLANEVGNLPLALILLRKRMALMSAKPGFEPADLLEDVKSRPLDAPHASGERRLRAVFAISYEGLPEEARKLFRTTGAFRRAQVASADIASIAELSAKDAEQLLDVLVLSSMAEWGVQVGTYVMHPLLQEYAKELLESNGEHVNTRLRHAVHFVNSAEINALRSSNEQLGAFSTIERDMPEYEH